MRPVPALSLALSLALAACGGLASLAGGDDGGRAPTAAEAAAQLATSGLEDHGCGHGFTVGTLDQTVQLSVLADAGHGDPPQPGTVELGDAWDGRLVTGRDLFAQWCDDVVEPDEPEVVQSATWQVEGTLRWELADGDGQCPSVATATLTDGVVVADGGRVELPPLEFRNEYFGCFAG